MPILEIKATCDEERQTDVLSGLYEPVASWKGRAIYQQPNRKSGKYWYMSYDLNRWKFASISNKIKAAEFNSQLGSSVQSVNSNTPG